MSFDFDTVIPRKDSGCIKFDRKPELDPFWVADMDFVSAPPILKALHDRVDHGIFGYAHPHAGVTEAVRSYLKERRAVELNEDHLLHLGGLVPALSLAARAFCEDGGELLTCTPVYYPFLNVHKDAGAKLLTVDHVMKNGRWEFDWEAMEETVTEKTKIFLLCNPQNPLGRVFTEEEIIRLAEFCEKHDLLLISDEIHCDLILDENQPHFSALNLPEHFQKRVVALLSPSKTWNIAGLGYAFAIIPDDSVRRRFSAEKGHTLAEINALSYYATEAAYNEGEPWRLELIEYLRSNRDELVRFINEECKGLKIHSPDVTYLAWIDARDLGVPNPAKFFEQEAGLFLSDGAPFGWAGYVRFNFACPRSRMLEGLEKMKKAIDSKV
ncbi:MalY/PatB family protein [Luteolibacter sp. AS25]|uniref:MalY/PatB family protein n=1 Tax=Luteolibacter sp. AS25 TaxID=3135776 RepID=UPI00398A8257